LYQSLAKFLQGFFILSKINVELLMTYIEFKKCLLDADITLPKFAELIKVSDKNIRSYKKKDEVPNTIAVIATSFALMEKKGIHYKEHIKELRLTKKSKDGSGFACKKTSKK
jgi:hypothetical protein